MTATKEKPITAFQIKRIMQNCAYQVETKNEWVQWVTEDVNRTSLKSITHDQAIKIMHAQTGGTNVNDLKEDWRTFDGANPKHRVIMAILHEMNWRKPNGKHVEVADIDRLNVFLTTNPRSPVKKKLMQCTPQELEKVIVALNGIAQHGWK
jgi:hypothetical protein